LSDRLLDANEVAELLAVPVTWVRQETRAGRMPCLELGRYRRYDAEAVHAWLEGCRAGRWNGRRKPTQREEA
jgi:excisionase family DNA binding protein